MDATPFHAGELEAQRLAGGGARSAGIRDFMPDQHRIFFVMQPIIFLSAFDETSGPVATALTGAPGFVQSPNATTLHINAPFDGHDPAADSFKPGAMIGVLGLDFETRRRNRANGEVIRSEPNDLVVSIRESFGNCPQYIQTRRAHVVSSAPSPAERLSQLDDSARNAIARADTFFVASGSSATGADMSHRGGRPGFIRVDGDTLTVPDFRGNRYFNTLGNFLIDPRAALLFIDFDSGDTLHLQGIVEVDWSKDAASAVLGAERLWRLRVTSAWRRRAATPLHWSFGEFAPTTVRTGTWLR